MGQAEHYEWLGMTGEDDTMWHEYCKYKEDGGELTYEQWEAQTLDEVYND